MRWQGPTQTWPVFPEAHGEGVSKAGFRVKQAEPGLTASIRRCMVHQPKHTSAAQGLLGAVFVWRGKEEGRPHWRLSCYRCLLVGCLLVPSRLVLCSLIQCGWGWLATIPAPVALITTPPRLVGDLSFLAASLLGPAMRYFAACAIIQWLLFSRCDKPSLGGCSCACTYICGCAHMRARTHALCASAHSACTQ